MNFKILGVSFVLVLVIVIGSFPDSFSEEFTVSIPFGAFNPELNTPAEVWYEPPILSVSVGDTVTWVNDDREGHTVTSGKGAGRFDWMDTKELGKPDGLFDSQRFMPEESWSYVFNKEGEFNYFCVIHPWMEGIIIVNPNIPNYPHDATGKEYKQFPIFFITPDRSVEINFSFDPKVIKTHEKVNFIYRFYDALNDIPLRKMEYNVEILQNNQVLYQEKGAVSGAGGDYRQWIFEEPGPILFRITDLKPYGSVAGTQIELTENTAGRRGEFTTIVYENPEKRVTTDTIVQPKQTVQLYYEIAVLIIVVPGMMLLGLIWYMKRKKPIHSTTSERKASPI